VVPSKLLERMTRFLQDILRQPDELERVFQYLCGPGRHVLEDAARKIRDAGHVYLTGIGSSWHAALSAQALFQLGPRPVHVQEASEVWQFTNIPRDSVVAVISRSGRSVEIVNVLAKARESGAIVVGITNSEDGLLAQAAQIPILVPIARDHAISVNSYSCLAAAAGALASAAAGTFDAALAAKLSQVVGAAADVLPKWQAQISHSAWPEPGSISYFLGRSGGLGTCHEARLLWEEGVKSPATAMGTSSFRHGPQEMISRGARFGLWIDGQRMRNQDLAVARDLTLLGASVMVVGQDLPEDAGELVVQLPRTPSDWQFLIDIIPAQLAAERLAGLAGVDCDSFRYCSYIVEDEYGLMPDKAGVPKLGK
jgi:glucosamine--fructose-6-phosphate aminotransferase (isomerizing)